ncbi:MAG: HAD family hydrolase [Lachnospiraceae bacterium]|nr:HAD family hydrolase [Lachnospiraceae bacterium]
MEIKGILFDKDGTLIDFHKVWVPAAVRVAERLCGKYGVPGKEEELLLKMGVSGERVDPEGALACKSYEEIAEDLASVLCREEIPAECCDDGELSQEMASRVSGKRVHELSDDLERLFYEEVGEKLTHYPTFTNVKQMLRTVKAMGLRVGIATSDSWKSTRSCLTALRILGEFSFFGVTGVNLPEKPDGQLIALAARQWKLSPEEIAVVGDTPNDMRFAKDGHALGIAVRSGVGMESSLSPLADYLIDSVADLPALIHSVNNKEKKNVEYCIKACV